MVHFSDSVLKEMSLSKANDALDYVEKRRWIEIHESLDCCPIFGYDIDKKGNIFECEMPF